MKKLAVYFPGIGYTTDKPFLYYGRKVAIEAGFCEERKISYSLSRKDNLRNNQEAMKKAFEELFEQTRKQLADIEWEKYDEILFVSKSIGTIVAAAYVDKYDLQQVKQILYTPLCFTFQFHPKNAVAFIGTKDPWSNVEDIIQLAKADEVPLEVYEDCNHSLETEDILKNLDIVKAVIEKTKSFMREHK